MSEQKTGGHGPHDWKTDLADAQDVITILDHAAQACLEEDFRSRSVVRLPASGRLLLTGDLHDNPFHLEAILRIARLDAAPDRHVILHELIHGENLINGMDFSYRMLVKAAELKVNYPDQVHLLLANHEIAQMIHQSVSKGAGDSVELFDHAVMFAFGDQADAVTQAIQRFIRAWPIALMTQSGILCSHSLPSEYVMTEFDPGLLSRDLVDNDFRPRTGSAYLMVWGRQHSRAHLQTLARLWEVKAFCIGHEHAETGIELLGLPDDRTSDGVRIEETGSRPLGVILNSDHALGAVVEVDLAADPDPEQWVWSVRHIAAYA